MKHWKKIGIILCCIVINFVGRRFTDYLGLPFWMDAMGTFFAVLYCGTLEGALVAAVSAFLLGLYYPADISYAAEGIAFALLAGFFKKRHMFLRPGSTMIAAFWLGLCCVILSVPLNLIIHQGYSGNYWGDTMVDMLRWYKLPLPVAATVGELAVDFLDKQLSVLAVYYIAKKLKKHERLKKQQKEGQESVKAGALLLFLLVTALLAVQPKAVGAENRSVMTVYDRENGLVSSEANAIAETEDGMIWIGSYAGLTHYNGQSFTFVREENIANVNTLFVDAQDRLWIGTNDSGLTIYQNGKFQTFNTEDGLPSNSIRCFAQSPSGDVYVGTSETMAVVTQEGKIKSLDNGLSYVTSLVFSGINAFCADNNGKLYYYDTGKDAATNITPKHCRVNVVAGCGEQIYAGTSDGRVLYVNSQEEKSDTLLYEHVPVGGIRAIASGREGQIYVGGQKGVGAFENGEFIEYQSPKPATAISSIHEDYQGNLWISYEDQGVVKLSNSAFQDESEGFYEGVTNAICRYRSRIYCGTDDGLYIKNADSTLRHNALTKALKGVRIRCLYQDSQDLLWISTYSEYGLIQSDGERILRCYYPKAAVGKTLGNDSAGILSTGQDSGAGVLQSILSDKRIKTISGLVSDHVRCTLELSDHTLAVGTANGLSLLKDHRLVGKLTEKDGLANTKILSMLELSDGTLAVGTDGAGIYYIRDGRIVQHIDRSKGLKSDIILKLVAYEKGYFAVTSNSIAYIKKEQVKVLNNFPYYNNFDIRILGENAVVMASSGIYIMPVAAMLQNLQNSDYEFYGLQDGQTEAIMSNSFGFEEEHRIYYCTNQGFMSFDLDFEETIPIKYGLAGVWGDNKLISGEDGVYRIPANTFSVKIQPMVMNYANSELYVNLVIDKVMKSETIMASELKPITLSSLAQGSYSVKMYIVDRTGKRVHYTKGFTLLREPHRWESPVFRAYTAVLAVGLIVYVTWMILLMVNESKKKSQLEKMSVMLRRKVQEQTKEIREREQQTQHLLYETVNALTHAIDAKDSYTSGHSRRVALYSRMLAKKLGKSEEEQELIYRAGLLHDVGKIRIPEGMINKTDRLSDDEFAFMKLHTVAGFHIISGVQWDRRVCYGARFHHERYDGAGYPEGRSGMDIPEFARIIGVADAYDAMTSTRSYREQITQEKARQEIENGAGKQFDPVVAKAMLEMIDEDKDYRMRQMPLEKCTILIVDDDEMARKTIELILKDQQSKVGHRSLEDYQEVEFLFAETMAEEMELLEKQTADIIFQDLHLPDGDGMEIMKEIHQKSDVPIIVMSGDRTLKAMEEAYNAGAADFIAKPFTAAVIQEMVDDILVNRG